MRDVTANIYSLLLAKKLLLPLLMCPSFASRRRTLRRPSSNSDVALDQLAAMWLLPSSHVPMLLCHSSLFPLFYTLPLPLAHGLFVHTLANDLFGVLQTHRLSSIHITAHCPLLDPDTEPALEYNKRA